MEKGQDGHREKKTVNDGNEVLWGVFGTVAASILSHVQLFKETLHQWSWNGSPRDNSCAQI